MKYFPYFSFFGKRGFAVAKSTISKQTYKEILHALQKKLRNSNLFNFCFKYFPFHFWFRIRVFSIRAMLILVQRYVARERRSDKKLFSTRYSKPIVS